MCRSERRADRTDVRNMPGYPCELGVRSPPNTPRAGADHSPALLRPVPDGMRQPRPRVHNSAADASCGIAHASGDRKATLRREPGRTPGEPRILVGATERSTSDLA